MKKIPENSCAIIDGKLYKQYDVRCREIREPLDSGKWVCKRSGKDFPSGRKFAVVSNSERGEDEIMIAIETGHCYYSYELLEVKNPPKTNAIESQQNAIRTS